MGRSRAKWSLCGSQWNTTCYDSPMGEKYCVRAIPFLDCNDVHSAAQSFQFIRNSEIAFPSLNTSLPPDITKWTLGLRASACNATSSGSSCFCHGCGSEGHKQKHESRFEGVAWEVRPHANRISCLCVRGIKNEARQVAWRRIKCAPSTSCRQPQENCHGRQSAPPKQSQDHGEVVWGAIEDIWSDGGMFLCEILAFLWRIRGPRSSAIEARQGGVLASKNVA